MKHIVKLMKTIIFSVDCTQFHVFLCLDKTILGYSGFPFFLYQLQIKFMVVLKFAIWGDKY